MFSFRTFCAFSLVALLLLASVSSPAQKKSRTKDAARHSGDAAETFTEIMNVKDKAIPQELLDTAEAIAVFPGVLKGAFVFGARGGQSGEGWLERAGFFQYRWWKFWSADWRAEDRLRSAHHERKWFEWFVARQV
jgi:lipid-binding SYLF domain-containing protein